MGNCSSAQSQVIGSKYLLITLLEAKDLLAADAGLDTADPYVKVTYGSTVLTSKTISRSLNPVWNQTLQVPLNGADQPKIKFELLDRDEFTPDDPMATFDLEMKKIRSAGKMDEWIKLGDKKSPKGKIHILIQYVSGEKDLEVKQKKADETVAKEETKSVSVSKKDKKVESKPAAPVVTDAEPSEEGKKIIAEMIVAAAPAAIKAEKTRRTEEAEKSLAESNDSQQRKKSLKSASENRSKPAAKSTVDLLTQEGDTVLVPQPAKNRPQAPKQPNAESNGAAPAAGTKPSIRKVAPELPASPAKSPVTATSPSAFEYEPIASPVKPTANPALTKMPAKLTESLALQYVHGYSSRDVHGNLFFINNQTLLYPAACVGVLHNFTNQTQNFFNYHKTDINAIDIGCHPDTDEMIVATGDIVRTDNASPGPFVYLWKPYSNKPFASLKLGEGKKGRAIGNVRFCAGGSNLVITTKDDKNTVFFAEWKDDRMRSLTSAVNGERILDVATNPYNPNEFITVGVKHMKFWTYDPKLGKLEEHKGLFEKEGPQNLICCTFLDDKHVATGSVTGDLYIWEKSSRKIVQTVKKAHKSFLSHMSIFISTGMFATVGGHKDNTLKMWQFRDGKVTPLEKYTKDFGFPLQAVQWDWDGARLAVGGDEGSIIVYKVSKEGYSNEIVVQKAHDNSDLDKSEVWGLDFHPSNKFYASASDDGSVRLWDIAKKSMLKRIDFPDEMIRDCAFSPNGQFLAIGTRKGTVYVVDGTTLKILHTPAAPTGPQTSKKQEMSLCWYPSGRFLAVGKGDGAIELHAIDGAGNLTMFHKFTGHSGNVQTMDFSADGALLRSYSPGTRTACEVLFWSIASLKRVPEKSEFDEMEWATCTVPRGSIDVQGVWESDMDASDINCVGRNSKKTLLAVGDDRFTIWIHRYPCFPGSNASGKRYYAHASHITNVKFSGDGRYLITAGGNDACVMEWLVQN